MHQHHQFPLFRTQKFVVHYPILQLNKLSRQSCTNGVIKGVLTIRSKKIAGN